MSRSQLEKEMRKWKRICWVTTTIAFVSFLFGFECFSKMILVLMTSIFAVFLGVFFGITMGLSKAAMMMTKGKEGRPN